MATRYRVVKTLQGTAKMPERGYLAKDVLPHPGVFLTEHAGPFWPEGIHP